MLNSDMFWHQFIPPKPLGAGAKAAKAQIRLQQLGLQERENLKCLLPLHALITCAERKIVAC